MTEFKVTYNNKYIGKIIVENGRILTDIDKSYKILHRELREDQPITEDDEELLERNTPEFVWTAINSAGIEDENYYGEWIK